MIKFPIHGTYILMGARFQLECYLSNVLARRVSRRPMDGHFWGKYIQNSPNLSKNLQGTCPLDAQLSISG